MGKNAHPPRGEKHSKNTEKQVENKAAQNDNATAGKIDKKKPKAGTDDANPPSASEPKKPDTRTLIGGASWTGKLPINLLSEHCQKQKWEKPEYTMGKNNDGFSSMVILRRKDPKTQEVTALPPFTLPPEHKHLAIQPTAVEARHFAAAYALFRVCSMRNLHMMLPPNYRDLWKGEFNRLKSQDVAAKMEWKYDADPFQSNREREAIKEKTAKLASASAESKTQANNGSSFSSGTGKALMKGWNTVAKVEMGARTRREVERLAKCYSVWNPLGIQIPANTRKEIVTDLTSHGFRQAHVEEASEICKDREEVLEWLLIHVPEDDLPKWALPEGYGPGISLARSDLKQEAVIKRLTAGGYSATICESFYDDFGGHEQRVAQALQNSLLGKGDPLIQSATGQEQKDPISDEMDSWEQEQEILASIYDPNYQRLSDISCSIRLPEVDGVEGDVVCTFMRPCCPYPEQPPILLVNAKLPSYIRLSITRKALEFAYENLIGEQMIFNLVDWIDKESRTVIANPGPLADFINIDPETEAQKPTMDVLPSMTPVRKDGAPKHKQRWSSSNKALLSKWKSRQQSPRQKAMLEARQALPAWALKEEVVQAVNNHQVVIVSGETGSGKSTQVVQFILDDMINGGIGDSANIICTQPRRISAIGLAERVAQERCSAVGEEIGYAIRGETKQSRLLTKVSFVTTGVLLRRLQTSGKSLQALENSLNDISHIFVDEVHERSLDTDFLLALLRDLIKQKKDLKIVLMSATLDAATFEDYFGGPQIVAKVEIQGRTFPVEDLYLDDAMLETGFVPGKSRQDHNEDDEYDISASLQRMGMGINYALIGGLVRQIDRTLHSAVGNILIFLPGIAEIRKVINLFDKDDQLLALPLHANLPLQEQRRVFAPSFPIRKVIAATNVAETSITIDDVVAVIDTGRVRETKYDPQANMVKLEEVWASRAACKQRRGRAGRSRPGVCYKLFTRNAEAKMRDRPDPEIRRVPLEQLCLSVKAMGIKDVPKFLANTLTPPETSAVEGGLEMLTRIGALQDDNLTSLGHHLSTIPADLRLAKLMVYGALFDYLEECLTIASILSVKSPFNDAASTQGRVAANEMRADFADGQGDLIADLHAYRQWDHLKEQKSQKELRSWCTDNYLSTMTLNQIASNRFQYVTTLKEIGFIPTSYEGPVRPRDISYPFLNALILSALHPQVLRISLPAQKYQSTMSGALPVDPESREIKYWDSGNSRVFIHPASTLFPAQSFPNNATFLSYYKKAETSKVFVNELTPCGSYGLMLFGGAIEVDTYGRGLIVDGWARLRGWARIGVLISRLRVILDRVLGTWIDQPGFALAGDMEKSLVSIVQKLIELEGMDA